MLLAQSLLAGGVAEMVVKNQLYEKELIFLILLVTLLLLERGFAIASAALTSLALFAAYVTFTGIEGLIFLKRLFWQCYLLVEWFQLFSALAMSSVGKAAMEMVYEVRRQFKEIPGIMKGKKAKPEYDKCVDISTKASLKEMMLPGFFTIGTPIIITVLPMLIGIENLKLRCLVDIWQELQLAEFLGYFSK